jgi:hypothetical protein
LEFELPELEKIVAFGGVSREKLKWKLSSVAMTYLGEYQVPVPLALARRKRKYSGL